MKKLFGGLNLTWEKIIIGAVIAGLYTGLMAFLPATENTSFRDISIHFEAWILFGILIIINSKSPMESALRCFVFFLISQPIVYLVQVPFYAGGWQIFSYYPRWFVWTLLTLPMGYIGYYMKKDKWWGLLILLPMLVFLGMHYVGYLKEVLGFFPHHLLSTLFCAATILLYPLAIFHDSKVRRAGLAIGIAVLLASTVLSFAQGKNTYSTTLLVEGGELNAEFDDSYNAYLEDPAFGTVSIVYEENIECYMVNAELTKTGETRLILESPEGEKRIFDLDVERDSYTITESAEGNS